MAKLDRDQLLEEGARLLRDWGVAHDAGPAALAALIGRAPAADLAIANRLGSLAGDESVRVLQQLADSTTDKLVRKEVKRALYRLEQRGVAVPHAPAPGPVPIVTAAPTEGYVSPVDGRGDQLVWLAKPRPGGLLHLFAVINDPEGLCEAEVALISRKALKEIRRDLAKKHEIELVEAEWRYCDFLVYRAFRWVRERRAPLPADYPALRAQFTKEPPAEDLPPLILAHVDAAALAADVDRLGKSDALLEEKEFRTWFFPGEELQPYLDEMASIRDSPLVLNRAQQEERVRGVVERAVEELFAGARRDSWVRRLYEMAHFFWVTRRREQAQQAVVVALALARSERGGREIPFCEHLARASLALLAQVTAEEEAERAKSSLILTPQQLRSQRERG